MLELVTAAGAANANSYVSVEEADAYFAARLQTGPWDALADDEEGKKRALIAATRRLDQEQFRGRPAKPLVGSAGSGPKQALKWPRWATLDDDTALDTAEIPGIVKDATCEEALALLAAAADGDDLLADSGLESVSSIQVGSLNVTPRHAARAGDLPEVVRRILRPVLATTRGSIHFTRA